MENYRINLPKLIKNYKNDLNYRISFEKYINTITKIFMKYDENNIDYVLKLLGNATNSNRVYIFEFKNNLNIMNNTYEWCSENVVPEIDYLSNLSSDMFPWWMKKLKNQEIIVINDVENIPIEGINEKNILKKQSVKSLLVIPLFNDKLHGFIGFDDTKQTRIWKKEDIELLNTAGNLILSYWDRNQTNNKLIKKTKELSKTVNSVIKTLVNITENNDIYTKNHAHNVKIISVKIALKLGLNRRQLYVIKNAAQLHDIGKMFIPKSILFKPNSLSKLEYEMIKQHAQFGYEIVKEIDFDNRIKKVILEHHERINGTGYPNGLKGNEILFESKIVAVADIFESMTRHRSYRPAISISKTIDFLTKNRGILFDSEIVNTLVKIVNNNELNILN